MHKDLSRGLGFLKDKQRWKLGIAPRDAWYEDGTDWLKWLRKLKPQRAGAAKIVQNKIGIHSSV